MITLLLFLLSVYSLNSQEIPAERYASNPFYQIDSSSNDGKISIKVGVTGDSVFNLNRISIFERFNEKLVAEIQDLYAVEDWYFPSAMALHISKNKLFLLSNQKYGLDSANNSIVSDGVILISVQTELQEIKKTLILVDDYVFSNLESEILEYKEVLALNGISSDIRITPRSESFNAKKVQETKAIIEKYEEDNSFENIIIIGRVPYAMSGHYTPDGHKDESFGAWPTDLYYAIREGKWTDEDNDTLDVMFAEHKNLASDGKFDEGYIPKDVSINIGRIDMYDLPYFNKNELELIKAYLNKSIKFRKGLVEVDGGVFDNGFEDVYKEKFVTEPIINYNALFGEGNYTNKRTRYIMDDEKYLFYWGAAPGGTNSIFDVIYSEEISNQNFNGVFNTLFGSRAVEWTVENNIMRSVIASEPMALTCRWGVRPFYYTFPMGVGKTIGFCHTLSTNGVINNSNSSSNMLRTIHQTLLGDPTLKMYYPKQVEDFFVEYKNNTYKLTWKNKEDAIGYNVYFRDSNTPEYTLLNEGWIRTNDYEVESDFGKNLTFLVKQIEKVENNQGYYFEESMGTKFEFATSVKLATENIIYPNPTSQFVNFKYNVKNIRILNLVGETVYQLDKFTKIIDLKSAGLANGIYLLSYEFEGNINIEKIILNN